MQEKKQTVNGRILKEQEENRYQKLLKLEAENYDVYGRKWERNFDSKSIQNKFANQSAVELTEISNNAPNDQIKIAGRLMLKRAMGKTIFATVQDQNGKFQVYINIANLAPEEFKLFNEDSDYGDFFGFHGKIMKTKTGELTIKVYHLAILAKALRPLPEKWHGITDIEERYRRRYLDLIMNEESKNVFIKRTKIIQALRDFFNQRGCLETETPILQHVYGGAAAKPFITFHHTLNSSLYLRIATELHLKRLIVGGFEGVYEIGRIFRNEGMSPRHNPEFTTVEAYIAYQDMEFMMQFIEDCIKSIIETVNQKLTLDYRMNGQDGSLQPIHLDFSKPWKRIKMVDAIKSVDNPDFINDFLPIVDLINQYETSNDDKIVEIKKAEAVKLAESIAAKHQINVDPHHKTVGHLINLFFEHFVEPTLIQPTFVYHYPVEISPLSKLSANSTNFTDRFELFIGGREYANAYSELNNPIEQYQRFQEQMAEKEQGNEEATAEIDHDYVEALEYGMPPTAGLGIGIDRLVMLLTGQDSIKDVLLFPHLKKVK